MGEPPVQALVDVRAAAPGDLPALVAVALAAERSAVAWARQDWIPPDPVTTRQLWWDRLRDEQTWVAAAVSGFTCVGCATAWPAPTLQGRAPRLAYLVGPMVDPDWWGEGIGAALLDEGLAVLGQLKFARVEVAVQAGNARARRFLERHGWQQAEKPIRRSPMALVLYGRDLGGEPIENRSQYAA